MAMIDGKPLVIKWEFLKKFQAMITPTEDEEDKNDESN